MDSCDVLIVGAGPAGSSCAWGLRSSGLDVLILEKSKFPRDKVCGGWITPAVFDMLHIRPEEYGQTRTLQPITGFKIGCIGDGGLDVGYSRIVSYGIRRCEFDEYLLRRCCARYREETEVGSIEWTDDGWIINGEIKARLLVGAGGHFCPVARYLGGPDVGQPVVAQEIEFQMNLKQAASCAVRGEMPELYFCNDMQGYGWCFRKGDYLNIGLGRLDPRGLPDHVRGFCNFLKQSGKLSTSLPDEFRGHAYFLFGRSPRRLVRNASMLIGDAAGLAYPQSGEGIRPAVQSGLLAAEVIQTAEKTYSRNRLAAYPEELGRRLSTGQESLEAVAQHLPSALRNISARLLFTSKIFCRRVVADMWFLRTGFDEKCRLLVGGRGDVDRASHGDPSSERRNPTSPTLASGHSERRRRAS
jgi:geranylgeranyl reductase family protein